MKFIVGHKWDKGAVNIGRPTPLGNPFVMRSEQDRDMVCDKYTEWLRKQIDEQNPDVLGALRALWVKAKAEGTVVLGCYCAPKRCHGDAIKAFLDSHIQDQS